MAEAHWGVWGNWSLGFPAMEACQTHGLAAALWTHLRSELRSCFPSIGPSQRLGVPLTSGHTSNEAFRTTTMGSEALPSHSVAFTGSDPVTHPAALLPPLYSL